MLKHFFENKIKKQENMYVVVIGCGRFGSQMANILSDSKKDVTVIDQNKNAFQKLSPSFGGLLLTGDALDLDLLEEARLTQAQLVVVTTNDDNTNIMISQMVKELFGVQQVIIRLYDSEKKEIYLEKGLHVICPSLLSIKEVSSILKDDTIEAMIEGNI